jgi:transposase
MKANKRLSLNESDLLSLVQLYPNGCGVEEASDVLQVSSSVVRGWINAGRQLRSGVQYKLTLIVAGDNRFEWDSNGEEE